MNYFQLLKKLYDLYDRNAGRVVDSTFIVKQIRSQIPFTECKVVGLRTLGVATNTLSVSGVYDPEADEYGKKPITIEIAFPKSKETFSFTEDDMSRSHWSELCIDFANILGHEYMHLNQFRRRQFRWCKQYRSDLTCPKKKEIQEYYGDPDEIDAYAFIAAAELAIACFSNTNHRPTKIERTRLYKTYIKFFDKNDPVIVKFVKLTGRYYKKLERQYHDTTFE
jgi:hypothetical protein